MMNLSIDSFPGNVIPGTGIVGVFAIWILTAIVHISFALAVLQDSQNLWRFVHRKTFFVGGGIWALATLLGGVFVAALYWLIHHSSLRPQPNGVSPEAQTKQPDSKPSKPNEPAS